MKRLLLGILSLGILVIIGGTGANENFANFITM